MSFQLTQTNILTTNGECVVKEVPEEEEEMIKALPCQDQPDPKKDFKDHQGNTVLLPKSLGLAKLAVDVKGKKEKGETALDIRNNDLLEAGARGGATTAAATTITRDHVSTGTDTEPLLPVTSSSGNKSLAHSSPETKGALLVVLVLFAGTCFGVVSDPPSMVTEARQKVAPAVFRLSDIVTASMPAPFYLLVGSTAAFASSMGYIGVILYYLPWTEVFYFAGVMVVMVYTLLLDRAIPRYKVKIRSVSISGAVFVWVSALTLIFCVLIVVTVLKSVCSAVLNLAVRRNLVDNVV